MVVVVGQTFFEHSNLIFCIVSLHMRPSVSNFDRNGPLVCHSVWKIKMIKIWKKKCNWLESKHVYCCWSIFFLRIRSWNSCIASQNMMPSLRGGRYIHQYHVPSTPCFHMNWVEHILMLNLCLLSNLLVMNSNSNHRATSSISYLGWIFLSNKLKNFFLSHLLGGTFYSKI